MARSRHIAPAVIAAYAGAAVAALGLGGTPASADPGFVTAAPPEVEAVRVDEKLGAQVPLDLRFLDHDGRPVTLGELVRGDLPVVLTFNYASCPMLCSLQLNGFVAALPTVGLSAGKEYRIVTVVIEPKEPPARAAETRAGYLDKLGDRAPAMRGYAAAREGAGGPAGWTFVVADPSGPDAGAAAIRRLADAVGVGYRYVPERAEWAHPAVLVFLSPSGTVTRYVHGIEYDGKELFASVVRAGTAEPSASAGFIQRCFHWDPTAGSRAQTGAAVMRLGAAAFAALVLGALAVLHVLRRERAGSGRSSSSGVARP